MSEAQTQEASNDSKAPRQKLVAFTANEDGSAIQAAINGHDPIIINLADIPEAIRAKAMIAGLIVRAQRFTDGVEGADAKAAALTAGLEKLKAGEWSVSRLPGSGGSDFSMTVLAAHEYRLMKAAAAGQTYDKTVAETAAEFAPIQAEYDAISERYKDRDDDEAKAAKAAAKLSKLKATKAWALAWAKVKAEKAARDAAKLEKKLENQDSEALF